MRGLAIAFALAALAVSACGGHERAAATRLTLLAVNPNVGRAVFHLSCDPPRGDVPAPAQACAALEQRPDLARRPKPFTCFGGPFSWFDIWISGELRGEPFRARTSSCWTPQMELLGRLGIGRSVQDHLVPRRTETVVAGTTRTILAGLLRPGDLVACRSQGHPLEVGVPVEAETAASTGFGGQTMIATLSVTRHRDGSVTAVCR